MVEIIINCFDFIITTSKFNKKIASKFIKNLIIKNSFLYWNLKMKLLSIRFFDFFGLIHPKLFCKGEDQS